MPKTFDIIAFDLDGTLADTSPDLAAALNHALVELDRPQVPAETVRHLIGHGGRALLRRGLAATGEAREELVEQGYPILVDYYLDHICVGTRPYEGVEAALDRLRAQGSRIAVCTNKAELLTFTLLDSLGWRDRFDAIVGGDTLPVRKPDPAPLFEAIARAGGGRTAFVGDFDHRRRHGEGGEAALRRGQLRLFGPAGGSARRERDHRSLRTARGGPRRALSGRLPPSALRIRLPPFPGEEGVVTRHRILSLLWRGAVGA